MTTIALLAAFATVPTPPFAAGAPPADVRAFCETFNDPVVRQTCLRNEQASKNRVERSRTAFHGPARQLFDYCETQTMTWRGMEACVRQNGVRSGARPGGTLGDLQRSLEDTSDSTRRLSDRMRDLRDTTREAGEAARETAPALGTLPPPSAPTSNVQVWGPVTAPTTAPAAAPAPEPDRPGRAVAAPEAERQLRGVLERTGARDAKCTRTQYGTGWVTVCE